MRWLALDTCFDACSVAAWPGVDGRMATRFAAMRQGHAEALSPMMAEVLAEVGWPAAAVEAIAVTLGPGTFTGMRIAIAAARGLALATGARIFATTSMALLAATARRQLPETCAGRSLAVCQNAHKGEIFLEIARSDVPARLDSVRLVDPRQAARLVAAAGDEVLLIGNAAALVVEAGVTEGLSLRRDTQVVLPDAQDLATVKLVPVSEPTPLYPRPPDARPQDDRALARLA